MNYLNTFAFQFYPYIALAVFFIGSWLRFDRSMYTWRTGSSQMLSDRGMRIGSNLFHVGMLAIIGGHDARFTPAFPGDRLPANDAAKRA